MPEYYNRDDLENTPVSLKKNDDVQGAGRAYPEQGPYYSPAADNREIYPQNVQNGYYGAPYQTKFCKFCGGKIPFDAVVCTLCGRQVEPLAGANQPQPQIIIRNDNVNNVQYGRRKNKWVAVALCFFLGVFGFHRFYEGKILSGLLYFFTAGLFGIGWLVDLIILLCKPNPYFV